MEVTITIPQNIIDVLTERGWDEEEIKVLFKSYHCESPVGLETEFFQWVEFQDEEELQDTFREQQELEVGMEVEIVRNRISNSNNEVGDVGIITAVDGGACRIQVEGRKDFGNWQDKSEIARVNY